MVSPDTLPPRPPELPLGRPARVGLAVLVALTLLACLLTAWLITPPEPPPLPLERRATG